MIQRLDSSLSFGANEYASVREKYNAQMDKNSQIAQKQNINATTPAIQSTTNNQIPMQGSGQKLDVVA